jgi:hypothetical protein
MRKTALILAALLALAAPATAADDDDNDLGHSGRGRLVARLW